MHARAAAVARIREPWFRERPEFTVALAVLMFGGILTLRLLLGDSTDAYSMLYVLPVALLATAFGVRVGAVGGLVAVALVVVWVLVDGVTLGLAGWVTRVVPLLTLGLLLGDASDRLRKAEEERTRLATAAALHREAIEINDSLVQGMVAAKWALEGGRTEAGLDTLDETIALGHTLVSGLIRDAGLGGRTHQVATGSDGDVGDLGLDLAPRR